MNSIRVKRRAGCCKHRGVRTMIIINGYVILLNGDQAADTYGASHNALAILEMRNISTYISCSRPVAGCLPAGGGNRAVDEEQTSSFDQPHYHQQQKRQYQGKLDHTLSFLWWFIFWS